MTVPTSTSTAEKLLKAAEFLLSETSGRALMTLLAAICGAIAFLLNQIPVWLSTPLFALQTLVLLLLLLCYPVLLKRSRIAILPEKVEEVFAKLSPEDEERIRMAEDFMAEFGDIADKAPSLRRIIREQDSRYADEHQDDGK